jgi:uncharacterized surface protein with fasciclin (FAS1) repeats
MKKTILAVLAVAAITATSMSAFAQMKDPDVGGASMYPNKTIVENAVNSPIHTTLVAAMKAAGPVDTLLKPENKPMLVKILTYHVVPGKISSAQLEKMIEKGHGKAVLKTVEGEDLTASMSGKNIILADAKGGTSTITTADVFQSNGVIHVIDVVLMAS